MHCDKTGHFPMPIKYVDYYEEENTESDDEDVKKAA